MSRDPALVELLRGRKGYPGPTAILDAGDRAWLRAQGVDVPDREEQPPLHEAARIAREERQLKAPKKKQRPAKKGA